MDLPFVFDNTETADATAGATGGRELAARMVFDKECHITRDPDRDARLL
jgi:hypothetical protein